MHYEKDMVCAHVQDEKRRLQFSLSDLGPRYSESEGLFDRFVEEQQVAEAEI